MNLAYHPLAARNSHKVGHPSPPSPNHARLEQRLSTHGNFSSSGNVAKNPTGIRCVGSSVHERFEVC